ncbi:helix-turn-helix domain-containing protein [Streptomyces sp. 6N223]|uniref:helix-turn-helix domain-containing protein n=1 Tax=Streptomyces sp. 6N223 TaxID=3457412 RepID=UPI003FCFC445
MSSHAPDPAPVVPLRPREPLWRHVVGEVLRRERRAQERTLKDVAEDARISMPYLSELERGRKEASSEVLAAAARALGLGLAELLTLVQDELARRTATGTGTATGTAERAARATSSITRLSSHRASGPRLGGLDAEVRLAA